ncbi:MULTISPECIES: hypothetical protein [Arthrobacter]|uniref:Uncharacterized protein n=1 Tax=Arthrobacter terricola TaxID=2547396 RepID=A0A4R5K6D2_9MICC|nr:MULTISPECIES: hypothetical protein [Arthrobacter]MBT8163502.1 hypothetical protein [Arthrobacter sp. GN70]TDF89453.1 hypothetical protein E1809_22870 [Arthrobacter terricola]
MIDLREEIDRPVADWLHAPPEREDRFDDLVDLALAMPKPAKRATGISSPHGRQPGCCTDRENRQTQGQRGPGQTG